MASPTAKTKLVIDANVIIKNPNLSELMLAHELITVPAVVAEIKDPAARARLATIAAQLKIETPAAKACERVAEFAKKTGDFVSLSQTDFQVIALACQKIIENGKEHVLRSEPQKASDFKTRMEGDVTEAGEGDEEVEDEAMEEENDETGRQEEDQIMKEDESPNVKETGKIEKDEVEGDEITMEETEKLDDDDGWISVSKPSKKATKESKESDIGESKSKERSRISSNMFTQSYSSEGKDDKSHPQLWYDDRDFEPNDEEGWITPSNLNNVMQGTYVSSSDSLKEVGVGVMTADFAMQVRPADL